MNIDITVVLIILIAIIAITALVMLLSRPKQVKKEEASAPSTLSTPSLISPEILELEKHHKEIMTQLAIESRSSVYDLAEASTELSAARMRAQARNKREQAATLDKGPS